MTSTMAAALFATKSEKILVTGSAAKQTNKAGPAGIGKSQHRNGVAGNPPAKFSGAARVLDFILVDKFVNAYESPDEVYGEVFLPQTQTPVRFLVRNGEIQYEGERLHGFMKLIPLVLDELRLNSGNSEIRDTFKAIASDYLSTGMVSIKDVLLFCDSFYYGYAKKHLDFTTDENVFEPETAKAAIRSGLFKPMDVLNGINGLPEMTVGAPAKEVKEVKSVGMSFDEIKAGQYVLNYGWSDEQAMKVPSLKTLEDFVPSEQFYSLVRKIDKRLNSVLLRMDGGLTGTDAIGNDFINALIVGKPGTGKTTLAYALGAALGMPVSSVPLSKNTEEDTFQGMNKVVDGKITFVPTEALNVIKYGGILVLEEINLADPAVVMGSLGQAIEKPFILMEDGYRTISRNPMCVVIGAMNVGTTGSKGVNQALSSRFKQTYMLNDPCKDDFIKILAKQGHPKKACMWVYNAYEKIVNYLKMPSVNADDIALNVTLRGCLGALENIDEGSDPMAAVRDTLIGKIAEVDLELAEKVYSDIRNLPTYK